ncbi:DNA-processing protein DprA [Metabacillus idriensis]|nr:DNA-processing protein DprA [Metabacillus idriensis]MDR0137353.1 DNA-processing protein DprA [Metabacillus idriensis]
MLEIHHKIIHLSHCRGFGHMNFLNLLKDDPTLKSLYRLTDHEIQQLFRLSDQTLPQFLQDFHSFNLHEVITQYSEQNLHMLTLFDENYPELLREIPDPPPILFYKGDISRLKIKKMISIVGTRNPTSYGSNALRKIVNPLVKDGWTIVSGLAKGIDALAHRAALSENGNTIGVIAGGLNHFYPKENQALFEQMCNEQLVLSEHPPNIKPQKWHFPQRNRIISGLSLGTVVMQAKEKSGSLITANTALDQGRQVFAVPGSIFDDFSAGANQLIKQGAYLAEDGLDIINDLILQV